MSMRILIGDVREKLVDLPDESVHCVVTSPPYYGLRDYGVIGQIGLEPSPDAYITVLVSLFREVRRVMRKDATLWLNLGDSYAAVNRGENARPRAETLTGIQIGNSHSDIPTRREVIRGQKIAGIKPKDLLMIPARVALALQADGWWLRSDIIWAKPNPMPESVTDRPTSAHEHVFLLAKSERYYFDAEAVKEPSITDDPRRPYGSQGAWEMDGRPDEQRRGGELRAPANRKRGEFNGKTNAMPGREAFRAFTEYRNIRNVWTIATQPYSDAHFATFPPALIEPCIKAGCPVAGIVLDPFFGAGTTGLVADRLGRNCIGIELNSTYAEMARKRIQEDAGIFAAIT